MKLLLLFAIFACFLKPSLTQCSTNQCTFGVYFTDSGADQVLRFGDTQAIAETLYGTLSSLSFTAKTSAEACNDNVCGQNSTCTNVTNSVFTCDCENGFAAARGNTTFSCSETDECTDGTHNCDVNANCTNITPGFNCTCNDGYTGNGTTCTDIDECAPEPCHVNATCTTPDINMFNCTCVSGYTGNGTFCEEIDECTAGTDNCHANATCDNTDGGFNCTCINGFSGDGVTCTNIDDCGTSPCHTDATCSDLVNNYTCVCNDGYSGDGVNFCNRTDQSINITFHIVCDNFTYDANLLNPVSDETIAIEALIAPAIASFVTSVDGDASVGGIDHSWSTSSDGLGFAQSFCTLTIDSTSTLQNEFLRRVNTITVPELNLTASADECELGIDDCTSDKRCADTPYRFCCYHDIEYRAEVTTNRTFNISWSDITHVISTTATSQIQDWLADKFNTLEDRGCTLATGTKAEFNLEGSIIHVLALLLQNATFTLQDITDELAKAVGESTPFGTVISAGDFNECIEAYAAYRNCSSLASCLNFAGSFSCACNASYYDNGTTPGEICINPITVSCDGSTMNVSILTDYYNQQNISLDALHLADESCNRTTHSREVGDSIEFSVSINDCNTTLGYSSDNSSIVASNFVSNLPSTGVFTGVEVNVPFQCALPANANITAGFNGTVKTVNLPNVQASGAFDLDLSFYNDDFTQKYSASRTYASNEKINAQISITNSISSVSVSVNKCYGTPSSSRTDSEQFAIMNDGCSTGLGTNFNIQRNGQGSARLDFQMFFFRPLDIVYFHVEAQVCIGTCVQTCNSRRRKRQATERTELVTLTLALKLDRNDPLYNNGTFGVVGLNLPEDGKNNGNSGLTTQDIALPIVTAALAFILIVLLALLVLVVVRKRRSKEENYDMTHVNTHAIAVKPPAY